MLRFETGARDGAGRLGKLYTAHGVARTPTLLPVLNPNLPLVGTPELKAMGCEMVITNSYVLRRKEELRERTLKEGVHRVVGWDGPVMTDSGTFQQYVYGEKIAIDPLETVAFQRDIGVDVGTALDVFSTPDRSYDEAAADVDETVRRVKEAVAAKGAMGLAATVQGSVYPALRRRCAEAYRGVEADVFPIGGVVPLMERQRYADLVEAIVAAKQGLDPSRPVHLFGAGHPAVFPIAAWLGCDLFDSSAYAKFAADGRMIFPEGTRSLVDLEETWCACPECTKHGAAGLKALPDAERERALALHNLHVSFAELRRVREAIRDGALGELVEERCRTHPALADALRAALRHASWIETLEPLSKPRAFLHVSAESAGRPEVLRARARLRERIRTRGRPLVVLPPTARPWSASYANLADAFAAKAALPAVESVFGPVPLDLDGAYPFAQSVEPARHDEGTLADMAAFLRDLAVEKGVEVRAWQGLATIADLPDEPKDAEVERVRALADWQFGPGAGDALVPASARVTFVRSPNTGKWRTVHVDGRHVLSLRAPDGLFTLKAAGARSLHAGLPAPRLRVVVAEDSVAFNREGKSVMAKYALRADPALRAFDECLVVDAADALVATGQLHLAPSEVGWFRTGVAAHVREGIRG